MKCHNQKIAIAAVGAWYVSNIAVVTKAIHKARAAQRDERNHFPYTSAMEWRNAAELLPPNTFAAEYCWRQWERIMHLPRRLAGPIGNSRIATLPPQPAPAARQVIEPEIHQISLVNAA